MGINWRKLRHPIRYGCTKSPDRLHKYERMQGTWRQQHDGGVTIHWADREECIHCQNVYRVITHKTVTMTRKPNK